MMKKIINIALVFTIMLFVSSCKDTLDAPSKSALDESVVFSTPSLAEGAIAGIIQSLCETESLRGRYLSYYGSNTDVEIHSSLKEIDNDKARIGNYNTNPNNTEMNKATNVWAKLYEGVERANLAIRGLRTYGKVESDPQMAQILGEILTLRAVMYADLIKGWGDVPARFEPINSETAYLPRSDRDVIYKQLLADLAEAETLLPWPNETATTATVERVNKAFAKGLRARLALAAGGYAQRLDGTVRLSNDPELSRDKMYEIARKECLDIIREERLSLLGFEEVFRRLNEENVAAGGESMWEIPFSAARGRVIFDLGVNHAKTDKYTGQAKGGTVGPNPIMLYEFDTDDVRRFVSVVPYSWDRNSSDAPDKGGFQIPASLGKLYFGKYRYEWMKRRVTSDNDDGLNFIYMRYADIYLMAAEAINELENPNAAEPYLRRIVERAFPNNAGKVNDLMAAATASKESFFNAIVDQRALEFTGEMLRKADLIRWNLLKVKLDEAKLKLQQLDERQGKYANLPKKIYYQTAADGETLEIYGLNFGDTDAIGESLNYTSNKTWTLSSSGDQNKYWDCLVYPGKDPNKQQYWPIWQLFVDGSNGMLDNKYLGL